MIKLLDGVTSDGAGTGVTIKAGWYFLFAEFVDSATGTITFQFLDANSPEGDEWKSITSLAGAVSFTASGMVLVKLPAGDLRATAASVSGTLHAYAERDE